MCGYDENHSRKMTNRWMEGWMATMTTITAKKKKLKRQVNITHPMATLLCCDTEKNKKSKSDFYYYYLFCV